MGFLLIHLHRHKNIPFCAARRNLSGFGNKSENKRHCYSRYTDVCSPLPLLHFHDCLVGDDINRTCLLTISESLLSSGTAAYYDVMQCDSNDRPPPGSLHQTMEDTRGVRRRKAGSVCPGARVCLPLDRAPGVGAHPFSTDGILSPC